MYRYETILQRTLCATALPRRFFVGVFWLTAAAGMVQASEIYKSIDASGNVVYSDHLDSSMSQSTVVLLEDPRFPPRELHFCWTNCFTLILDNGVYRRSDGTDESWTVETFTDKAIVLHRHDAPADWNGHSQDVVYAGQVSNDRLIGVTLNGEPVTGIDASWGTALNTLPGSNAERDAKSTANPNSSSSDTMSSAVTPPPLPPGGTTQLASRWLPLDAGVLVLARSRILLDSRCLGAPAPGGRPVDPRVLELRRHRLRLSSRILGFDRRLLRRGQLRIWLFWKWLFGGALDRQFVHLQQRGKPLESRCRPSYVRPVRIQSGFARYLPLHRWAARWRRYPHGVTTSITDTSCQQTADDENRPANQRTRAKAHGS